MIDVLFIKTVNYCVCNILRVQIYCFFLILQTIYAKKMHFFEKFMLFSQKGALFVWIFHKIVVSLHPK